MNATFEDKVAIAKFLGWDVVKQPHDAKYPELETYKSINELTQVWDGSQSVYPADPDYEKEKQIVINELWRCLIHNDYGRATIKDWNGMMAAVGRCFDVADLDNEKLDAVREALWDTPNFERVYSAVLDLAKWYNSNKTI